MTEIASIPGYFLFKPIEVSVKGDDAMTIYAAQHSLPTGNGKGKLVSADGPTIDDAVSSLGRSLGKALNQLSFSNWRHETLNED